MLPLTESSLSSLAISALQPWSTVTTEYSIPSEYAAKLASFKSRFEDQILWIGMFMFLESTITSE